MAIFPICSPCQCDFKTVFVFSLALIFPVSVKILSQWEFQWEMGLKIKYALKTLSDGIFANLRPLYNSNMAKVYIVKWCHNLIFINKNPFLAALSSSRSLVVGLAVGRSVRPPL